MKTVLYYFNVIALIMFNLFGSVFKQHWLVVTGFSSLFFLLAAISICYLTRLGTERQAMFLVVDFVFISLSFTITYFVRLLLAKTFTFQHEAEIAAESVSTIFNNLPDAVMLLSLRKTKIDKGAVHF